MATNEKNLLPKNCKHCRCFITGHTCWKSDYKPDPKKVFVLMPFEKPYLDYYKFAIKEVYSPEKGYECTNARESTFVTGEYIVCKICFAVFQIYYKKFILFFNELLLLYITFINFTFL